MQSISLSKSVENSDLISSNNNSGLEDNDGKEDDLSWSIKKIVNYFLFLIRNINKIDFNEEKQIIIPICSYLQYYNSKNIIRLLKVRH